MGFITQPIPDWLQWIGLIVGIAGTGLTVWAALNARNARIAAEHAALAARRIGREVQVLEILEGMGELQTLIARGDLELTAMKAGHLNSQIVRFASEAYDELEAPEQNCLIVLREQISSIVERASQRRGSDDARNRRIQLSYAFAKESLSRLLGGLRRQIRSFPDGR